MLVPVSRTSSALSRPSVALLVAVATSVFLLPTLRVAPASAQTKMKAVSEPATGAPAAGEDSSSAKAETGDEKEGTSAAANSDDDVLAEQLRAANNGDYWAKYRVWSAYAKGAVGVKKDPEKAKKWLAELVDDAYLAKFEPVNGFAPKTPAEFLDQFHEHSSLRSEPAGLGGASFFRTTAKDGVLIGSFLTAYPDKMRRDIAANPSLKLISIEKVTPETFVRYDASPQESLPDKKEAKTPKSDGGAAKATAPAATELHYGDGKPGGKRSLGGSGEMIQFSLSGDKGKITGIRIHGSRYGTPQPPAEDFLIYGVSEDQSEVLFTETAPYKLFARGDEKWVDVKFKKPREVPKTFWIVLDFKAHQTKGVYVSYDTSSGGKHSKSGLPGQQSADVDFGGDWMIRVQLEK
jgi:RNA polymerase sigma-70 factor (ECF subfamily)